MIPHHLQAVLRNRESVVVRLLEVFQRVAVIDRLGGHRTFFRRVVDRLRRRCRALGLVHRNPVGRGVTLEHRQLPGRQLVLVLRSGGGSDHELRLFAFEWITEKIVGHRCGTGFQTTGPGGNGTAGIAGLFTAQRRQGGAQFCRFFR
ncbi:hypothetical protein D3C87_1410000 [compost metagenome]